MKNSRPKDGRIIYIYTSNLNSKKSGHSKFFSLNKKTGLRCKDDPVRVLSAL